MLDDLDQMLDSMSTSTPSVDTRSLVSQAAQKYGVPEDLAWSVAKQESGGNPNTPNSRKGAIGVMQLMPDTAKDLGVDPHDVKQNIDGGVRYLAQMLDHYQGDRTKAAAAYNAGPGTVDSGKPLPRETRDYIASVAPGGDDLDRMLDGMAKPQGSSGAGDPLDQMLDGMQGQAKPAYTGVPGMERLGGVAPGAPEAPITQLTRQAMSGHLKESTGAAIRAVEEAENPGMTQRAFEHVTEQARRMGGGGDPTFPTLGEATSVLFPAGAEVAGAAAAAAESAAARQAFAAADAALSAYFTYQSGKGAAQSLKGAKQAYDQGDYSEMTRQLGAAGVEGFFAWLGTSQAAARYREVADIAKMKNALQAKVNAEYAAEQMQNTGPERLTQAPQQIGGPAPAPGEPTAPTPPRSETAAPATASATETQPAPTTAVARGDTFDTPDGKITVKNVSGKSVIYTLESPDGTRTSKVKSKAAFQNVVGQQAPVSLSAPVKPEDISGDISPDKTTPEVPATTATAAVTPSAEEDKAAVKSEPEAKTAAVALPPSAEPEAKAEPEVAATADTAATAEEPTPHKFSSTQASMPAPIADAVREAAAAIPDEKLAEDGREAEPHVTVKYGIHSEDPAKVRELLAEEPPIKATLGEASVFHNPDGDVLKVAVESPQLNDLNEKIAKAEPHTDTHPDYQPHVTIAYLKPGEGDAYEGKPIPGVTGQEVTLPSVTFSSKNGEKTEIPLKGQGAADQELQDPKLKPPQAGDVVHWLAAPKGEEGFPSWQRGIFDAREGDEAIVRPPDKKGNPGRPVRVNIADTQLGRVPTQSESWQYDLARMRATPPEQAPEKMYRAALSRLADYSHMKTIAPSFWNMYIFPEMNAHGNEDAGRAVWSKLLREGVVTADENPQVGFHIHPENIPVLDEAEALRRAQEYIDAQKPGKLDPHALQWKADIPGKELRSAVLAKLEREGRIGPELSSKKTHFANQHDVLGAATPGPAPRSAEPAPPAAEPATGDLEAQLAALRAENSRLKSGKQAAGNGQAQVLRMMADSMQKGIDEKRNPAIANQNPTARRARIAGNMAREADRLESIQTVFRRLADLHESGELPEVLKGVKSRTVIEGLLPRHDEAGKGWTPRFSAPHLQQRDMREILEKTKGMPGTAEGRQILERRQYQDVAHFNAGQLPALEKVMDAAVKKGYSDKYSREGLTDAKRFYSAGIDANNWDAARAAVKDLLKGPPKEAPAERKIREAERDLIGTKIEGFFPTPKPLAKRLVEMADIQPGMSVLEPSAGNGNIADELAKTGADVTVVEPAGRLRDILALKGHRVGGSDFMSFDPARDEELRADLGVSRERLDSYDPEQTVRKLGSKWLYRTVEGADAPAVYETRHAAVDAATKHRGLKQQMLERPGDYRDIASVRASKALDLIKKYQAQGMSEMEAGQRARQEIPEGTVGQFDRIVMNPPFERGQDMDHVRHAFDLLKPGGRLVAIMSEGSFGRGDKKATGFREWLDEQKRKVEKLPEGSFTGKDSQRQTGVATRVVVIDKPVEEARPAAVSPRNASEQSVLARNFIDPRLRSGELDDSGGRAMELAIRRMSLSEPEAEEVVRRARGSSTAPANGQQIGDALKELAGQHPDWGEHALEIGTQRIERMTDDLKPRTSPETRAPWEMRQADYARENWQSVIQRFRGRPDVLDAKNRDEEIAHFKGLHASEVAKAVDAGQPVPLEVLQDYPALKKPAWHAALTQRAKIHNELSKLREDRKNVGTLPAREVAGENVRLGQAVQEAEAKYRGAQARVETLAPKGADATDLDAIEKPAPAPEPEAAPAAELPNGIQVNGKVEFQILKQNYTGTLLGVDENGTASVKQINGKVVRLPAGQLLPGGTSEKEPPPIAEKATSVDFGKESSSNSRKQITVYGMDAEGKMNGERVTIGQTRSDTSLWEVTRKFYRIPPGEGNKYGHEETQQIAYGYPKAEAKQIAEAFLKGEPNPFAKFEQGLPISEYKPGKPTDFSDSSATVRAGGLVHNKVDGAEAWSDGHVAFKSKAPGKLSESGTQPDIQKVFDAARKEAKRTVEPVGFFRQTNITNVVLAAKSGEHVAVNGRYYDYAKKAYPNATFKAKDSKSAVGVYAGDDLVGVIMPMRSDSLPSGIQKLLPGEADGGRATDAAAKKSRYMRNPERGSAPMLTDLAQAIVDRFGKKDAPKVNYSGLGGLKRSLLPGRNLAEVEQASRKVFEAALPTASADAITSTVLQSAVPAIKNALEGSNHTWDEQRLYYTESRLRGLKERWADFADQVANMSQDDLERSLQESPDGQGSPFLSLLEQIEGKQGIDQNLGQTATAIAEAQDWDLLRDFMQGSFLEAHDRVAQVMPDAQFDNFQEAVARDSRVKEADRLYGEHIEKPMAEAHAINEGVFSNALGPANRYIPLVPMEAPPKPGPGRRLPYHKPRNASNAFATGLSRQYDPSMEQFAKKLSYANRSNYKANLIQTMRDSKWLVPEAKAYQTPEHGLAMRGPDGEEYKAVREEIQQPRTLIQNGKVTHLPARFEVMPAFMNRGMKAILAREPMDPDAVIGVMRWANMLATKGPMELVFHSAGVLGSLYANTPFLGPSGLDKALSVPLVKWFGIRGKLIGVDPTTPENVAKLHEMAKAGALPAKSGKVTYSKEYAESTGAKREPLSFAPLLYGPKGIDARARILMYDIFKAAYPNGTRSELHHFVNQLANYTPELQGRVETFLKQFGIGPFATAGMTRIVNSIHSYTGTGPQTGKTAESKLWWWLASSAYIAAAAWVVAHKYLTGKYPTEDKRSQFLQIPVGNGNGYIDQYRHSKLGNSLWGNGPEVGYLSFAWLDNPLALRGARAMGLADAYRAHQLGADNGQVMEAAQKGMMNAFAHPALGPASRAIFVGVTGEEPYLTGLRDRGSVAMRFYPAIPQFTKPGLPRVGAQAWAAAKQLNSFYTEGAENLGGLTGFAPPSQKRGDWFWKEGANILAPGLVSPASNPWKASNALRTERHIESLPHFAKGGHVETPTKAVVGEAGPEAIINSKDKAGDSSRLPTSPLSEKGKQQVQTLAEKLKAKGGADEIFTSELPRTSETAEILSEVTGAPIVYRGNALETWKIGSLAGKPLEEVTPELNRLILKAPNEPAPGKSPDNGEPGESAVAFEKRGITALNDLLNRSAKYPDKVLIACTSSKVLKLWRAYSKAGGKGFEVDVQVLASPSIPRFGSIERFSRGSNGKIRIEPIFLVGKNKLKGGVYGIRHGEVQSSGKVQQVVNKPTVMTLAKHGPQDVVPLSA